MQTTVQPFEHLPSGRIPIANGEPPLRILRLGAALRERLLAAPSDAGRVHSVFERALNILWHDGRLVTLHGPGPLAAPFAAAVTQLPNLGSIPTGAAVCRRGRWIHMHTIVLDADSGMPASICMQPGDEDPARLASLLAGQGVPSVAPGLSSLAAMRARQRLAEGIRQRDGEIFTEGGCALVGLGEGLTPAGDDCLVGALAVLHRFAGSWLRRRPEIGARIAVAARTGTTLVGREFVLHALEGAFSEILLGLIMASAPDEVRDAAKRLAGTGATSGADTLAGVHLALEALSGRAWRRPTA